MWNQLNGKVWQSCEQYQKRFQYFHKGKQEINENQFLFSLISGLSDERWEIWFK